MVDPVGPRGPPTRPVASASDARTPQATRGRRIRLPYGLPGQPATPCSASYQVVQFYAAIWPDFTPPLTDSIVRAFNIENGENGNLLGYVNAGITLLNRRALKEVNLLESTNFEADLFSRLIELEQVKPFFNRSVLVCCRNAKRPRYRKFRRKGRPPRRGHRFIARQLDAAASRAGSWPV